MSDTRKQLSYTAAEIDARLGAVPNKVDKETGKGLSTNDYTNADKTAVGTIGNKVDKETGKGLSTNDYTNADKTAVGTIGDKVNKETGKGLSTNDYTTPEKNKLAGLSGEDLFVLPDEIASNTDLNSLSSVGCWRATTSAIATSLSNIPEGVTTAFSGATIPSVAGSRYIQILVPHTDTGEWYKRRYNGSWQPWSKYTADPTPLLAELVDREGKNLLANDAGTKSVGSITFTMNDDRSITVSGTSRSSNSDYYICTDMPLKAGTYVLSGCPSGGNNSNTYKIQINGVGYDIGDSYEFTLSSDTNITVYIRIWSGYTPNNLVFRPMICTKADWIRSKAYVPSALSNLELTQLHTGKMLASNVDLDTLLTEGVWYGYNAVGSGASNLPVPNGNYNIRVENKMIGAVYLKQICTIARIQNVYTEFVRVKNVSSGSAWQPWEMVSAVGELGWELAANDDLDDFTTPGYYQCTGSTIGNTLSNSPTVQPFKLKVDRFTSTTNCIQEITAVENTTSGQPEIYRRVKLASGWKSWYKFTGTVVT